MKNKFFTQLEFSSKPTQLEVLMFSKHLALMIKSGISLAEALAISIEHTSAQRMKKVLQAIYKDVENGQTFAKSLAKHPQVFDNLYISLVSVSEASGTLEENMQYVTEQLEKRFALQKKIKTASLYPTIVLIAAVSMAAFLAFVILPQLIDFFTAFDVELPPTTRLLLFIANLFKFHGLLIGVVSIGIGGLALYLTKAPFSKPLWDAAVLRIPVVGSFIVAAQLSQFSRNLGMLIRTGVPITTALEITAKTVSNSAFSSGVMQLQKALIKGKNIANAIENEHIGVFPTLTTKLIGVGEKTGKLDESLLYLADYYEAEVESTSRNLTTVLEPLLLLGIGLLVGFVALAIITPIYELSGSIRK